MTSLYINPDGAYDGQQRSLEDCQFDLENVLTVSQLVGKSAEECNAASVMLDNLAGTKNKTAAEDAGESVDKNVLYAMLAANAAGRAKVIVREDATKNGAWAWARLRETPRRRVSQKCFNAVGRTGSRSKTCGTSGSRRSRSFHKSH